MKPDVIASATPEDPRLDPDPGGDPPGEPPRAAELDELTLARAQRDDAAACRAVVVHHQGAVFALLGRMVGRHGPVEDLAQETFLRVFRALPRFDVRGPARVSTWILTIATRLAIDELRRRRARDDGARAVAVAAAPELLAPDVAERHALGAALEAAIAALPVEQRAAFLLRELHGLEYREIAETLEIDLNTVKSRLFRARASLQEALAALRGPG